MARKIELIIGGGRYGSILHRQKLEKYIQEGKKVLILDCDDSIEPIQKPIWHEETIMSEDLAKFCASNPQDLGKIIIFDDISKFKNKK